MLFSVLSGSGSIGYKIISVLIIAVCTLLSITLHELGHGFMAYLLGDRTAKYNGRLSLNPLSHLDPIGALCLFLFGFGWAKPVPVNPYNFKNMKGGMVLTSIAGPLMNFIIAFFSTVITTIVGSMTFSSMGLLYSAMSAVYMIFNYLAILNLGLGLFNLIPIPPLDGSKILGALLPTNAYFKYMQYERFGFIILILIINMPFFNRILYTCMNAVLSFYDFIISGALSIFM